MEYKLAMNAGPVSKLTEGQRDCLRRVLMHQTSKDIARDLGISPHTVDQRLRVATKTLGVSSRIEAARALARSENLDIEGYQSTVYQSPLVAPEDATPSFGSTAEGDRNTVAHERIELARERQLTYQAFVPQAHLPIGLPLPLHAGEANQLDPWQRLGWIAAIAVAVTLAFGALLAGVGSLSALYQGSFASHVYNGVSRSRH